ncbi:hypothetical protein [Acidithiobacillus thiooxidans]|uniref:Uncharacterized protein n=1 Tax=Acidithiobacillus thiooxidans TaxID=930 RepID=A0A1C2IHR6_ACITH|nr:hypothetical protein [Acidithiobacillus thiooxidans]OCX75535.1 hypothetical protein A6M23_01960 [Acidithiobacillus thiooxidans]OCX85165.1 hypothetical protein A6P08_08225 [Acidithiobacillus thiooxidans]
MPFSKQGQERFCDLVSNAARQYSSKEHPNRDLPQICAVTTSHLPSCYTWITAPTSITTDLLLDFASDFNNNPQNNFARLSVTDADVTKKIQSQLQENPDHTAWQIIEMGEDAYRKAIKEYLQEYSIYIALHNWFVGYGDPDPSEKHYLLAKEYCRLFSLFLEEIRDDDCAEELVFEDEDNEEAIAYNAKVIEKWESLKAKDKKDYAEWQSRVLLAEIAFHHQTSTAAIMPASHRTPQHRKRTSAGHGAATKAGDDGDGDGDGDGEPPRPRSPHHHSPTLPLHHSLTHSLTIAGGAQ